MSFIERMRQKSEKQQKWIAFGVAFTVTLAIAAMWGLGASEKIAQRNANQEATQDQLIEGTEEVSNENKPIVRVETSTQKKQINENQAQFASPIESVKAQFSEIMSLVKNISL